MLLGHAYSFTHICNRLTRTQKSFFVTFILDLRSRTQGDIACAFHSTSPSQEAATCLESDLQGEAGRQGTDAIKSESIMRGAELKSRCIFQEDYVSSSIAVLEPTVS